MHNYSEFGCIVAHSLDLCNDNDTESYVMGVMQVSTGSTLFGDLVAVQKERIGRREMLVKKMSLALNTLYEYLYFEDYFDKDLLNDSRNPYFMVRFCYTRSFLFCSSTFFNPGVASQLFQTCKEERGSPGKG